MKWGGGNRGKKYDEENKRQIKNKKETKDGIKLAGEKELKIQ